MNFFFYSLLKVDITNCHLVILFIYNTLKVDHGAKTGPREKHYKKYNYWMLAEIRSH